jgi:hypothetical protein
MSSPPHATIDISLAARTDVPRAGEAAIICAACGETRQCAGAALVTIVPLSEEAKQQGMREREDMLPLCADCLASPTVSDAVARHFYPDLKITEGGNIPTQ